MAGGGPALAAELLHEVAVVARLAPVRFGENVPVGGDGCDEDGGEAGGAATVAACMWPCAVACNARAGVAFLLVDETDVDSGGCSGQGEEDG